MFKYLNVVDRYEKKSLLLAINCIAGLSIFFFGYDQGMMSGVNNSPDYISHMKYGYTEDDGTVRITNSALQGGIVGIYYVGTLIGALIGGYLGDKMGRIRSIEVGCFWAIVGAILQCSAQNAQWMCAARVVNGTGTGILNAIVPVWSAETAEYKSRGTFIALEFTLNIFGVLVAYWLEYSLSFINNGFSAVRWRFPIGFQTIPLVFLLIAIPFFPESPRFLVKVGQNEKALYILKRLRGTETNEAFEEYNDIVHIVQREMNDPTVSNSYIDMFFETSESSGNPHIARRVHLVIWLQILQEWIGIAGITVYAPTIFADAGFNTNQAALLSGLNNVFYTLSTLVNAITVDRIGRRWTLYWGAVGQAICMFISGIYSRKAINNPQVSSYGAISAAAIFAYTSIFGATWLVVPWLYPTEIFPLPVRARGNAFGVVGWSIGNGWLTLLCPVMFDSIYERTLYIFGVINVFTIPIVWAFYPETSQRTLEEIDFLFMADSPFVWDAEREFARLKANAVKSSVLSNHLFEGVSEISPSTANLRAHIDGADSSSTLYVTDASDDSDVSSATRLI
ncbi:general substrate transporter [Dipodascopsis uninucleata]